MTEPPGRQGSSEQPLSVNGPSSKGTLDVGVVTLLGIQQFGTNMLVSFPGVFLPQELERMGFKSGVTGLLFACFPVAVFISSPLWALLSRKVDKRSILYAAIALEGLSALLFGLAHVMAEDRHDRLALMFVSRTLQGVAASASSSLLLAIALERSGDREATVSSVSTTFMSLGFILGPFLGGALYAWGGFALPFVTVGAGVMLVVFLLPCAVGWPWGGRGDLERRVRGGVRGSSGVRNAGWNGNLEEAGVTERNMRGQLTEGESQLTEMMIDTSSSSSSVDRETESESSESVSVSVRDFLSPLVLFICAGMGLRSTSIGFIEPTYAQQLERALLVSDPRLVSLFFCIPGLSVVLSAWPVGALADAGANRIAMIVGGNCAYIFVFAFIGPFEPLAVLLGLTQGDVWSFVLVIGGLLSLGVAYNFAVVPAASLLIRLIEEGIERKETVCFVRRRGNLEEDPRLSDGGAREDESWGRGKGKGKGIAQRDETEGKGEKERLKGELPLRETRELLLDAPSCLRVDEDTSPQEDRRDDDGDREEKKQDTRTKLLFQKRTESVLLEAMKEGHTPKLKKLNLSENEGIGTEGGAEAPAAALKELEELDLRDCDLYGRGVKERNASDGQTADNAGCLDAAVGRRMQPASGSSRESVSVTVRDARRSGLSGGRGEGQMETQPQRKQRETRAAAGVSPQTHEFVVSGVVSMQTGCFAVGEAVGPLLGGFVAEVCSPATGYFVFGCLLLLYALGLCVIWVCRVTRRTKT